MKSVKYKKQGKKGLFDEQNAIEHMNEMGNPLEKISSVIDFEFFRSLLESELLNTDKKNNAGAKPYDYVMMFKILILQRYFGLGDKQIEFQIVDRMSFKQFLGLETGDKVPDEKTVWLFIENLTESDLIPLLFELFVNFLEEKELILNEGRMIDASFTLAPKQRNTREENEKTKVKAMNCGMTTNIKNLIKILMQDGQRKITKHFLDIKTMQRHVQKANF